MAKKESREVKQEFVYIRRVTRPSRLDKEVLEKSKKNLTVFVKNDRIVFPLEYMSEKGMYIMSAVMNVSSKDTAYPKAVENYFVDTDWKIPSGDGRKLNITLDIDDNPVVPHDYIVYLVALSHIKNNSGYFSDSERPGGGGKADYYIFYPEKAKAEKVNILEEETEAMYQMAVLFKNNEQERVNWILSYFGIQPYGLDANDKKLKMSDIVHGSIVFNGEIKFEGEVISYKKRSAKFFEAICKDEDIELKSMIETLIRNKVISVIGSRYFMGEEELGNTMEGVLLNMKEETPEMMNLRRRVDARFEVVKKQS